MESCILVNGCPSRYLLCLFIYLRIIYLNVITFKCPPITNKITSGIKIIYLETIISIYTWDWSNEDCCRHLSGVHQCVVMYVCYTVVDKTRVIRCKTPLPIVVLSVSLVSASVSASSESLGVGRMMCDSVPACWRLSCALSLYLIGVS